MIFFNPITLIDSTELASPSRVRAMDSLPTEIIDAIGQLLDVTSAVRFSRTCWRNYETTQAHVLKVTRHKRLLDEIQRVKYEVCERGEEVQSDYFDRYCGVRTYPDGRVVGSLSRIYYDGDDADMQITVFFATQVKICTVGLNHVSGYVNTGSRRADIYFNNARHPLPITRANVTDTPGLVAHSTIQIFEGIVFRDYGY